MPTSAFCTRMAESSRMNWRWEHLCDREVPATELLQATIISSDICLRCEEAGPDVSLLTLGRKRTRRAHRKTRCVSVERTTGTGVFIVAN